MTTAAAVLWCLSYRYRVRPRTAHQHSIGSGHDVVHLAGPGWYCLNCPRSSEHVPPFSIVDLAVVLLLVVLTLALAYSGYRAGALVA